MKYKNVYLEVGIHDEVAIDSKRSHFQAVLETLEEVRKEHPEEFPYSISSKLIYGSDWFMPIGAKHEDYLAAYVETFGELDALRVGGKTNWSDSFFRGNALDFLNAKHRIAQGVDVRRLDDATKSVNVSVVPSVKRDLEEMIESR